MQEKLARLEEQVDDWLYTYAASELGKGGDEDEDPPPLRLNYPVDYLLHAWSDYKLHGHWPRPGGFDAQDEALVADFQTLTRRYNWHAKKLAPADGEPGRERDLELDNLITGIGRANWNDLIGE